MNTVVVEDEEPSSTEPRGCHEREGETTYV